MSKKISINHVKVCGSAVVDLGDVQAFRQCIFCKLMSHMLLADRATLYMCHRLCWSGNIKILISNMP